MIRYALSKSPCVNENISWAIKDKRKFSDPNIMGWQKKDSDNSVNDDDGFDYNDNVKTFFIDFEANSTS